MRVLHQKSCLLTGFFVGWTTYILLDRALIPEDGVPDWLRPVLFVLLVGFFILATLLWNFFQTRQMDTESLERFLVLENALQRPGLVFGLNEVPGTFGFLGDRNTLRLWCFAASGGFVPTVVLRIGSRVLEPELEERHDVAEALGEDFKVPLRCGLVFSFSSRFGFKRLRLEAETRDGKTIRLVRMLRFSLRMRPPGSEDPEYRRWFEAQSGGEVASAEARPDFATVKEPRRISVLLPVYNTPPELLELAIRSVVQQTYPHWELCIADDASTRDDTRDVLRRAVIRDNRIKVRYRSFNGHISEASNTAFEIATGDLIGLLDHDDEITPNALAEVALAAEAFPKARLFYSDEDKIDLRGNLTDFYFKPDFDPYLLERQNYFCHFSVINRNLFEALKGFRAGLEGSQDWDLFLRASRLLAPSQIVHIPKILYHWRKVPGSTARAVDEKDYSRAAGEKALREHLEASGVTARVRSVGNLYWDYETGGAPGPALEFDLVQGQALGDGRERAKASGVDWILCNYGKLRPLEEGRERLWAALSLPHCGIAAPRILDPRGRIAFAGSFLRPGAPAFTPYAGLPDKETGMGWRIRLTNQATALSVGLVAVRMEAFLAAGGFQHQWHPEWTVVDLCLRIRALGWDVLYAGGAVWEYALAQPKRPVGEVPPDLFGAHRELFDRDPSFNPNLSFEGPRLRPNPSPRDTSPAAGRGRG